MVGNRMGLFDLCIAKHGISDELRRAIAEDCAFLANSLRDSLEKERDLALRDKVLLDEKVQKVGDDREG